MIRIEWKIPNQGAGNGQWLENNAKTHAALAAHVHKLNHQHGANTHWIATK